MEKIIIENQSSLPLRRVAEYVLHVIDQGRVSGDSYCFVTVFYPSDYPGIEVVVRAHKNPKSDKFLVYDEIRRGD